MKIILGVFSVILLGLAATHPIKFFRRTESPKYQVIKKHHEFEDRLYDNSTWLTMAVAGPQLEAAQKEIYPHLYKYFQGQNSEGLKINWLTTVRTGIQSCYGASCATVFSMAFLIPEEHAKRAPQPVDPKVEIVNEPAARYAARAFYGSYTEETDWLRQASKLAEKVQGDYTIDPTTYYLISHSRPHDLIRNYSEILVKIEKKVHGAEGSINPQTIHNATAVDNLNELFKKRE
ncbi:uncharacterized protein LOC129225088 [Uloborus diversus]|uniref:uncharacterized protein LOC129225088 n=1 Tax=Uloborus diversus TaxID=327109 RepID=UPI0024096A3C|nr:uncharacterized protein LOC129225088 [Uloborus diversus]